jgi:hypothetical protein
MAESGRRTKLTPEVHKQIVAALRLGATQKIACTAAGIGERTFYEWLERGGIGEEPWAQFSHDVESALGLAAIGWLETIEASALAGNWTAAAWKLERRFPEEFGQRVRHDGKIEHDINIFRKLETMSDAELMVLVAERQHQEQSL